MVSDRTKKILLAMAVFTAFCGAALLLFISSQQKQRAELTEAVQNASSCLAGGYHAEDAALMLALRGRQLADPDINVAEHKWPAVCVAALDKLGTLASEHRGDEAGDALIAAVAGAKEVAGQSENENVLAFLTALSGKLRALWQASAELGVEVAALSSETPVMQPSLDLGKLKLGTPLGTVPLRLERLATRDARQHRYAVRSTREDLVLGYCSITPDPQTSLCARVPETMKEQPTRVLGFSEPGLAPLFYSRGKDDQWRVVDSASGQELLSGYAGGAWVSEGYTVLLSDHEDRDDALSVLERQGDGPLKRRVLKLKDIDAKAKQVRDAVIAFNHLLIRVDPDSVVYALSLPLGSELRPERLGASYNVTFCRIADEVAVVMGARRMVHGPGGWHEDETFACPQTPRPNRGLSARGGAIWVTPEPGVQEPGAQEASGDEAGGPGPKGKPQLLLDPHRMAGQLTDKPFIEGWSFHPHRTLQLKTSKGTYLIQLDAEGKAHPIRVL